MSPARLLAIAFIFLCTTAAWSALGGSVVSRTGESDTQLSKEVAQLWGGQHKQLAPQVWLQRPRLVSETVKETDGQGRPVQREVTKTVTDRVPVPLGSSQVKVDLVLEHRQKGLLWYDTYTVGFAGRYRVRNADDVPRQLVIEFAFPSEE